MAALPAAAVKQNHAGHPSGFWVVVRREKEFHFPFLSRGCLVDVWFASWTIELVLRLGTGEPEKGKKRGEGAGHVMIIRSDRIMLSENIEARD